MKNKPRVFLIKAVLYFIAILLLTGTGYIQAKDQGNNNEIKPQAEKSPATQLVIRYDFNKGIFDPAPRKSGFYRVRHGRNVKFQVVNVNLLKYKVSIDAELKEYNSKPPEAFGTISGKKEDDKKKDEKKETSTTPEGTSTSSNGITRTDLESKMASLPDVKKELVQIKELPEKLQKILFDAETYDHLIYLKKELLEKHALLSPTDNDEVIVSKCEQVEKGARKLREDIYKQLKDKQIAVTPEKIDAIRKLEESAKKNKIEELVNLLKGEKILFTLKDIESLLAMEKQLDEFKEKKYVQEIKKILGNFSKDNFSVSLTVPTLDADAVHFTVTFEPLDKKFPPARHPIKGPVVVKISGGLKIDFSTGVIANLDPFLKTYSLKDVETGESNGNEESKVQITKEDARFKATTSIAVFMHAYRRPSRSFALAGTFGISNNEDDLSYYLGGSLIFGRNRRVIITLGLNYYNGMNLKDEYKVGSEFIKTEDIKIDNYLETGRRVRAFLSISYNL